MDEYRIKLSGWRGMLVMEKNDFDSLCRYARSFSQLDEEKIQTLHTLQPEIMHRLPEVTERFYQHLLSIPKVQPFLKGRLSSLKHTHHEWLEELFTTSFDAVFTEKMYVVGDVHVKAGLPVEFMAGAMSITQGCLIGLLQDIYAEQPRKFLDGLVSLNAATGFSLLVMQESYQTSSLSSELERFLSITGMSRKLFDNLARAYR